MRRQSSSRGEAFAHEIDDAARKDEELRPQLKTDHDDRSLTTSTLILATRYQKGYVSQP